MVPFFLLGFHTDAVSRGAGGGGQIDGDDGSPLKAVGRHVGCSSAEPGQPAPGQRALSDQKDLEQPLILLTAKDHPTGLH